MTFSLVANYWVSGSLNLTNGQPFGLESAEGVSGIDIVRFRQGSPLQHGVNDLGFRLQPRVLTLNLVFKAVDDATLDSYRDQLIGAFRPTFTVTLVATRDDGGVRSLRCVPIDDITIDLAPELRPGHTHRAVVKLKSAGDPTWYSAATIDTYTGGSTQTWWTAGGLIGTANVMEHVEFPGNGQAWTYAGTITGDWSIAFRGVLDATDGHAAFHAGTGALQAGTTSKDARLYYRGAGGAFVYYDGSDVAVDSQSGTPNYIVVRNASGNIETTYYSGTASDNSISGYDTDISGTARRWRSDRLGSASSNWANQMPKAAIYNKALSSTERVALDSWMGNTATLGTITAVNSGDINDYPYITIQGPIIAPVLTNSATGAALNFGSVTLGSSDIYRIDLRTGLKTVTDVDGNSVIANMGSPVQLARFFLTPGTNNITVQGGSVSTTTSVAITHYNRYLGV